MVSGSSRRFGEADRIGSASRTMLPFSTSAVELPLLRIISSRGGFADVSVLDVSATALDEGRRRLGDAAPVHWLHEDLLVWQPERRYGLWHDRALFHFLVDSGERDQYLRPFAARSETRA